MAVCENPAFRIALKSCDESSRILQLSRSSRQNVGTKPVRAKTIFADRSELEGGRVMARVQNGAVLKSLRVLINAGPLAGLSDGQLLARFTEADGEMAEVAFAAIVDRHGPMIRRICGQMLGNLHDAQDAFQACFFILARKARSVRARD
jgi:hypothetical protein